VHEIISNILPIQIPFEDMMTHGSLLHTCYKTVEASVLATALPPLPYLFRLKVKRLTKCLKERCCCEYCGLCINCQAELDQKNQAVDDVLQYDDVLPLLHKRESLRSKSRNNTKGRVRRKARGATLKKGVLHDVSDDFSVV
jgi:hypothetical protein